MVIFFVLFLEAFRLLDPLLGALFLASNGMMSLMALLVLGFGALAIFVHQRWAWAAAIISILVMVGLEQLAPHESMLVVLGAIAVAGIITVVIKRYIFGVLRRDAARPASVGGPRIPGWAALILRLI